MCQRHSTYPSASAQITSIHTSREPLSVASQVVGACLWSCSSTFQPSLSISNRLVLTLGMMWSPTNLADRTSLNQVVQKQLYCLALRRISRPSCPAYCTFNVSISTRLKKLGYNIQPCIARWLQVPSIDPSCANAIMSEAMGLSTVFQQQSYPWSFGKHHRYVLRHKLCPPVRQHSGEHPHVENRRRLITFS